MEILWVAEKSFLSFQIDGKINAKIQSVYFVNFPIYAAHFTLSGNEFLVGSSLHGYYYSYDMMSGKIVRIPWDKGNLNTLFMLAAQKYSELCIAFIKM